MNRVVFLNRFYWPEEPATAQLLVDLAEGLAARGQRITVVTRRSLATPRTESRNGVTIERVAGTHWGEHSVVGRVVDFATFHLVAAWTLLRIVRREDVVIAMTDPPLVGVTAWIVAVLKRAFLVHWVQDIYPEVAVGLTGHRWLLAFRPLRNAAWKSACACVLIGEQMARSVRDSGIANEKIHLIPNWAPIGLEPPLSEQVAALRHDWGLEGKFVAGYAGNLGRVHDLEPLLDVAFQLLADPNFVLIFIGAGAQRASIEAQARAQGLDNVRFFPLQRRRDLAPALAVADVQLVTLRPGAEQWVLPSKLYCAAAVARPIIFVGQDDCEVAQLIAQHRMGAAFTRADTAEMARTLRRLRDHPDDSVAQGWAALRFAAGGASRAIDAWHILLTRIAACAAGSAHPPFPR